MLLVKFYSGCTYFLVFNKILIYQSTLKTKFKWVYVNIYINQSYLENPNLMNYLYYYFMLAKQNIEREIKNLQDCNSVLNILKHLNFWSNFGLNFRDTTFVDTILKDREVLYKLSEVLEKIEFYLLFFLNSSSFARDENACDLRLRENSVYIEIALKFFDMINNLSQSKLTRVLSKQRLKSFEKFFKTFNNLLKLDLNDYRASLYDVVGYSYLDNKGNFRMNLFINLFYLVYADTQTEYFFQCDQLEAKNFFRILTQFSKFNIRHKFGENFYDFKKSDCRVREFVFTIDLNLLKTKDSGLCEESKDNLTNDNLDEKIFSYWSKFKTLLGRISTVLLPLEEGKLKREETQPVGCILLETKLSKFRENFDEMVWKELFV
jgi:hypothetical protein